MRPATLAEVAFARCCSWRALPDFAPEISSSARTPSRVCSSRRPAARQSVLDSGRPVLQPAIGLRQHRQNDVALVHRPLTFVTEYSGSSSPYARARFATDRFDQSSRSVSVMGDSTITIRRVFGGNSTRAQPTPWRAPPCRPGRTAQRSSAR